MNSRSTSDIPIPPESVMLKAAYRKSGLTVADLAAATGLSVASINIAMSGFRYRSGQPRPVVPPDGTLVSLASVLRLHPEDLRDRDRGRAAELLQEAYRAEGTQPMASSPHVASTSGSDQSLASRVLAAFTTDELRAELERREHEEYVQQGIDDAASDLAVDRGVL